jgi:LPXTG-motif cell wall-anchored protein
MKPVTQPSPGASTILGIDSYVVVFGGLSLLSGLLLFLFLLRRRRNRRTGLARSPAEELTLLLFVLSSAFAGIHELITDHLCHGSCL